jgi:hypothetical protein
MHCPSHREGQYATAVAFELQMHFALTASSIRCENCPTPSAMRDTTKYGRSYVIRCQDDMTLP